MSQRAPIGETSNTWAGVYSTSTGVNHIEAVVKVPTFNSDDHRKSVSVWVGIDGAGDCDTQGLWQTGFDLFYDGRISPWVEWWPDGPLHFKDFIINGGDTVKLTIDASSSKHGVATLENLTTGKHFTHGGWAPDGAPLCQQTAEWIVEDYDDVAGNGIALFVFGTLEFTGATATGKDGKFGPGTSKVINLATDDGIVHTDASSTSDTVSVKFMGKAHP